ncbi:unnamed protein product [Owenia fusiformis]|uniref:Uncharacterized protein n=1 Tax=Owenia fusiformis TaxID=6347 RepID=A0A8J1U7J6_OWEFU|nr:unnamed protein product [Owenia fusiformis]
MVVTWILVLSLGLAVQGQKLPHLVGSFAADTPGFTNLYEHRFPKNPKEKYSLIFSSFLPVPFVSDQILAVKHIGKFLGNVGAIKPGVLADDLTWPREPSQIPYEVFEKEAVCSPYGFLVPGKNDGSIEIIDVSGDKGKQYDIVRQPGVSAKDWFFHTVVWKDVNGDGRIDIITARARQELFTGITETEVLWLEHPTGNPFTQPWKQRSIAKDVAGVFIREAQLTSNFRTYNTIITPGYFTQKLSIFWTENIQERWDSPADVNHRTIDEGLGKYFDAQVVDMNNDGKPDVLFTINAAENGSIWILETPDDFKTGTFIRHKLADGFDSRSGLMGGGNPGSMKAFYPNERDTSKKPYIMMSGDDGGTAYILTPKSERKDDWEYELHTMLDEGEGVIIGKLSAADVDGDGYTEIFASSYTNEKVHVYSYGPARKG